ncbi:MAG TPA: cobalamin biosynthesis protein CbiK [Nitrospirae bacterium]|nr:sirohydrochlorin cobaltochelatase CbiKP precursor [bacterium BMS3Abin06]HDH12827.1 cobalamin biosynthesis protein CbiK [Nitrospirota bacterium]HDH50799.1 cobalamin biosynthesis protein CbiK [Nitrospirota bacterium]HDZ01604.1 cobalamin biosynthesis protein CbiK [Nitrospirota bacterium]
MKEKKLRKRTLKDKPAILIAAFGTSARGGVVYEIFDRLVKKKFSWLETRWAYTSEIIREKTGHPGVTEALASLEAEGYRRVVVQPLHVFPGTEYQILSEVCESFPGLRTIVGETLLHRWRFVEEALDIVSIDFLSPEEGINMIAAHGTPLAADPANILCLGLDNLLSHRYDNVFLSTLEGIPGRESAFRKVQMKKQGWQRARLIPFMYVAGLHVEEDLMGEDNSFMTALEETGFEVDWVSAEYEGVSFPKSLGFYDDIPHCFLDRLKRSMELMRFY